MEHRSPSVPESPSAPPDWVSEPGRSRVERFILGPEIGRGGMGRVHKAWDPMLCRVVALKVLLKDDPLQIMQFLKEAQSQARVEHPNVCRIYEVGSGLENSFIAMQLIDGQTLGQMRLELSLQELVRVMADVAGAVHAAHRHGLVHRDIKPGNILLEPSEDGHFRPYILDFGLARDLSSLDTSLSWGLVGTPAFMSPEQARGERIGPPADVYSLGASMYAALTGLPPHDATTLPGLIQQQAIQEIRSLKRMGVESPRDLETILQKCLESNPLRRYSTAFALEEDLRRWLAGEPILARPVGPFQRLYYRMMKHRTLTAVTLVSLLVTGGLVGWNFITSSRAAAQNAVAQRLNGMLKDAEYSLRFERMLPFHSVRPAMERLADRIPELEGDMKALGAVGDGPGHYTIGRLHLAMNQMTGAQEHLERAWAAGFRHPDVAMALLEVLSARAMGELRTALAQADGVERDRHLPGIRAAYLPRLQELLRRAKGTELGNMALGQALVDIIAGDYRQALTRSREAYTAKEWLVEARLAEVQALQFLAMSLPEGVERSEVVGRWGQGLEGALAVCPSDERIFVAMAQKELWLGLAEQRQGRSGAAALQEALALCAKARRVRSDCPLAARLHLELLRVLNQIDGGIRDPRPALLAALLPIRSQMGAGGGALPADVAQLTHELAWAQYRYGEDPREWIEWANGNLRGQAPLLAARNWMLQARVLADRGQDASRPIQEALRLVQDVVVRGGDAEGALVLGLIYQVQAQVRWDQGLDSRDASARAQEHLRRAFGLRPGDATLRGLLVEALVHAVLLDLQSGGDGQAQIVEARGILQGLAVQGELQARMRLAGVEHLAALSSGRDSRALLRKQIREFESLGQRDPKDFRLRQGLAHLALLEARFALAYGGDPEPGLLKAEAWAQDGLTYKTDHFPFQVVQAEAAWLRMQGPRPPHHGRSLLQERLDQLKRINPNAVELRWMEGRFLAREGRLPDPDPPAGRILDLLLAGPLNKDAS